jgi:cell fate regulator YaaT (PSP1 superfamily)
MAKEQGLSLNPTKISGQCGRLMCCLTFECEMYQAIKKQFPKIGKIIETKIGKGKVIRHNTILNRVVISLDEDKEVEIELDQIL